jgi:ribosomal protein S14
LTSENPAKLRPEAGSHSKSTTSRSDRIAGEKGCSILSIHLSRILFRLPAVAGNLITGLGSFGPCTRTEKGPTDKAK